MQLLSVFETVFDGVMTIPTALVISVVGFVTVILILSFLAVFVLLMGKVFDAINAKKAAKAANAASENAVAEAPVAPKAVIPEVTLYNVEEPDAAVIMAIVSDKSGIPLNRLKFNSIKLVEDK